MSDFSEQIGSASLEEIKRGYRFQPQTETYVCLFCGHSCPDGIVQQFDGQFYEARKWIQLHIRQCHGSAFQYLLNLDKKLTGLTDHQKTLLEFFYTGQNDQEIARALGTEATSTIRNHRFALREKQKQAKLLLAIMELLQEAAPRSSRSKDGSPPLPPASEEEKILAAYFKQGLNGPLSVFPLKEKKRVAILQHLVKNFGPDTRYPEKEVNEILQRYYEDYALLRRCLIEYGFMDRTADGSAYWLKQERSNIRHG